ncbi:STM3941 family protein [Niabella insulamsoli]|uniref:STM3941 family protein n=1 Tax=Niabella insulamsoli TaxID=3144874 RepID=UPI0031FDFE78
MPRVRVPLDKSKATKRLVLFVLLLILFTLMAVKPSLLTRSSENGFLKVIGYIGTFILIFPAALNAQKVFTKKAGLIIDDEGISDNSMNVSFAKIAWKDISEIRPLQISGDPFIALFLKQPERFIANEPSPIKRKMLELNYASLKTPINIAAGRLNADYNKLLDAILNEFEKSR